MSMDQETWEVSRKLFRVERPFAITMWDFSWIERRWPPAAVTAFGLDYRHGSVRMKII